MPCLGFGRKGDGRDATRQVEPMGEVHVQAVAVATVVGFFFFDEQERKKERKKKRTRGVSRAVRARIWSSPFGGREKALAETVALLSFGSRETLSPLLE